MKKVGTLIFSLVVSSVPSLQFPTLSSALGSASASATAFGTCMRNLHKFAGGRSTKRRYDLAQLAAVSLPSWG